MDRQYLTITPWKPTEQPPIFLHLPRVGMTCAEVDKIAKMFIVAPITEVRWQYGHENPERTHSYSGDGHYVV